MTKEELKKIINICSNQEEVREAVKKNHDNNLWWPLDVDDYKKRLLIAGLSTRISYNMIDSYRKVINNLNSYTYDEIKTLSNDELIKLIADNVNGASYKVAQCCVLYMRGYYSGIMPVDSGMKDVELPCLGFEQYKNAVGHDILRKELEKLTKDNNMKEIIKQNGYEELKVDDYNNATWFCHLVLIYYKRYFCNKHNPENCPLKNYVEVKCKCRK